MKQSILKISSVLLLISLLSSLLSSTCFAATDSNGKTPSGIEFKRLPEFVDSYAKKYIGETTAGAAVAVLKDNDIVLEKYYGYGDVENKIAISENSMFEWGSTSKLLLWVSVMQLVEQGKLDLNTDIKKYLPENFFKKLSYDDPITLMNLMNHNAGWEDQITGTFFQDQKKAISLQEVLRISEPYQVHRPGEMVSYSNYGACLAAYIIEYTTGVPYYEYVNKNIFDVLGMKSTSMHPLQEDNAYVRENRPKTKGYTLKNKEFKEGGLYYVFIYPAGGAVGTLGDLCKFANALIPSDKANSLLFQKQETLSAMLSKSYAPCEDYPGICHGFWEQQYKVRTIDHGGNTVLFTTQLTIAPEEKLALVVMTNQYGEKGMCSNLKDAFFGSYKPQKYKGSLPDSKQLEGEYQTIRRPFYGFSRLLTASTKISAIDKTTIKMGGNQYHQIRPYVYQYTNQNGASKFIYFNVDNNEVKSIYTKYEGYQPVSKAQTIYSFSCMILLGLCSLYFMLATIKNIVMLIRKKLSYLINEKEKLILNTFGLISVINTVLIFTRFIFTIYSDLKIHFMINMLYVAVTALIAVRHIIGFTRNNIKKEGYNRKRLPMVMSIIYAVMIILCQLFM